MSDNPQPERIQLRRTKGWRKPERAVVVARPSRWGNPYVVGRNVWVMEAQTGGPVPVRDRQHAVDLYRNLLDNAPSFAEAVRAHLAGRDLACWCPDDQPCHADVLLAVANGCSA
jgi:hypothetical protein